MNSENDLLNDNEILHHDPLLKKIEQNLNMDQKDIFIKNFYCYLNTDKKTDFVIDFDQIWEWLGFSQKDHCKVVLEKFFKKEIDYKINLHKVESQNKEQILLTVNTFKKICLKSNTEKAYEILDYYIKMEEIMMEYKKEQFELQLQAKEQELIHYKEKTYEEIQKTGHVYVIKTDGGYKVGKTKDINNRVKGLQTGNVKKIEMILDFKTSNSDLLERVVHYILDRYRCNSNREFFDCNIDYIKSIVMILGNTIDTLKSTYHHISKEELSEKINQRVGININDDLSGYNFNFYNWLDKNIQYKNNSLLQLSEICKLYSNTLNIHSSISSKYKKEIENYIKENYKQVKSEYGVVKIGNKTYNGWKHLCIKNLN